MAGVRIRWRGVARVAAIVAVGLIALSIVPSLLHAPAAPPLGRDVGLPRARPATSRPVRVVREKPRRREKRPARRRSVPDAPAATGKIGTRTRHHHSKPVESSPPPEPEYAPPAAPEPAPTTLPEPPPAPESVPGDGSQEFAPH
jgi:hypothetical protein